MCVKGGDGEGEQREGKEGKEMGEHRVSALI